MSVLVLFRWEGDPDELLAAYDRELKHPVPRKRPRPFFLSLFTQRPRRSVLGTSHPRSCITGAPGPWTTDTPPYAGVLEGASALSCARTTA
jgi:hypothetical protein